MSGRFERRCRRCGAPVTSTLRGIRFKERLHCESGHACRTWDVVEVGSGRVILRAHQDVGALEPADSTPEPEAA